MEMVPSLIPQRKSINHGIKSRQVATGSQQANELDDTEKKRRRIKAMLSLIKKLWTIIVQRIQIHEENGMVPIRFGY